MGGGLGGLREERQKRVSWCERFGSVCEIRLCVILFALCWHVCIDLIV